MLFFFLLAVSVSGIESNNIGEHTDTAKCICDLTEYSCDSFCCCDTDCIASITNY